MLYLEFEDPTLQMLIFLTDPIFNEKKPQYVVCVRVCV